MSDCHSDEGAPRRCLPTALEQGTDVQGLRSFCPGARREAIVETLNKAVVEALRTPAVRQRILELGSIAVSEERTTPQYLAGFIKSEIEKWAGPIRASGVTMD
jgi:tripartite-type tricarboxylate transporter receptor subunit TctC